MQKVLVKRTNFKLMLTTASLCWSVDGLPLTNEIVLSGSESSLPEDMSMSSDRRFLSKVSFSSVASFFWTCSVFPITFPFFSNFSFLILLHFYTSSPLLSHRYLAKTECSDKRLWYSDSALSILKSLGKGYNHLLCNNFCIFGIVRWETTKMRRWIGNEKIWWEIRGSQF